MAACGPIAWSLVRRLLRATRSRARDTRLFHMIALQPTSLPARRLPHGHFPSLPAAVLAVVATSVLTGCSLSGGGGSLLVDPSRYTIYHCNDLASEATALAKREKELRDLMDKASEGGGGTVIGTLAYRSDLETVLQKEKMVKDLAAEKKCPFAAVYGSDQTIR
jgi:hypothetical protein